MAINRGIMFKLFNQAPLLLVAIATLLFPLTAISQSLASNNQLEKTEHSRSKAQVWTLWKKSKNLTVEYRDTSDKTLIEIRAKATINSSLSAVLLFLQDTKSIPNWLHNTRESIIIKEISARENISIITFDAFWPIKAREMIIHSQYWQNNDLSVEVAIEDVGKNYQQYGSDDVIQINIVSAHWNIYPKLNNTLDIEHTIIANPNGSIPNWLANHIALKSMWKTLVNINNQLPKSPYQQQHLANIQELK